MKNKKILRIAVIITAVIFIASVSFVGVCAALALTDNCQDKYTMYETDDSFLDIVLKNAVIGREFTVSETQMNTYLNNKLCGTTPKGESKIKNLRLYFHSGSDTEIYAKIKFLNHDFAVYSKMSINLDSKTGIAAVRFYDTKLGELSVPDSVKDKILINTAEDNDLMEFRDGILYVQTKYIYEFKNCSITLNLEKFEPTDSGIKCKTNNLTLEALKALKDYFLSADGQALCKKLFGYNLYDLKDSIIGRLFG